MSKQNEQEYQIQTNSKSTKDSIRQELEAVVKQLNEVQNSFDPEREEKAKSIEQIIKSVDSLSIKSQETDAKLKEAKITIAEAVSVEIENYNTVLQGIDIQTKELESLTGFKKELFNLVALKKVIEENKKKAQEEQKRLEAENKERKVNFDKEYKEHKEEQMKNRAREEEEYQYDLEQKHKRNLQENADQINEARERFNEEVAETKVILDAREDELDEREKIVEEMNIKALEIQDNASKEIELAKKSVEVEVQEAVKKATTELEHKHEIEILSKNSRIDLARAKEEELSLSNAELKKEIARLNEKLDEAYKQVEAISRESIKNSGTKEVIREVSPK